MEYRYEPKGVCSYEMIIEVDGDTIKKVTIEGGCAGNTVGVSKLIEFLLEKYEVKTYYGVLGFILSSIIAIPIAALAGRTGIFAIPHVIAAVIFLALGVVIGYKLGEK